MVSKLLNNESETIAFHEQNFRTSQRCMGRRTDRQTHTHNNPSRNDTDTCAVATTSSPDRQSAVAKKRRIRTYLDLTSGAEVDMVTVLYVDSAFVVATNDDQREE
jgi:hypothetical protein